VASPPRQRFSAGRFGGSRAADRGNRFLVGTMAVLALSLGCGQASPQRPPAQSPPSPSSSAAAAHATARTTPSAAVSSSPLSAHDGAPKPSERPEKHVAFRYELRGHHFPLPLVHGTVAGTPTWMLVDTGANSHVVAGWLARQVGLPLKKLGDLGSDHAGRTIATFRVDHPRMTIDEWGPVPDGPMLATEVPALIEELGIGAFVSPQRLVEGDGGGVVLDFVAGEMRADHYEAALRKLGRHGSSIAPNGGRVCEDDASPIQGLAFVIPASVEGRTVDLLVDTGAERSDLLVSSGAARALTPRSTRNKEQLYAASGRMTSRTVHGATVSVGDFAVKTDLDLIPGAADPYCPRDGVVSMDVLHACILVLGRTAMSGRCGVR
jgi:predicted aspartyl protease